MSVRQAARRITQYRAFDVAEKLSRYLSCTRRSSQRSDFELILTVKMETRHPIEGYFGSEFRGSAIIAELSLKSQYLEISNL